jgi:hypothetical protein
VFGFAFSLTPLLLDLAHGCASVFRLCGFGRQPKKRVWAAPNKHKKKVDERKRKRLLFGQKVILLLCLLTVTPTDTAQADSKKSMSGMTA